MGKKRKLTVFINYTLDAYGGEIIREVKKQYMEAMCYYRAETERTE
jgi:hypothetical protein